MSNNQSDVYALVGHYRKIQRIWALILFVIVAQLGFALWRIASDSPTVDAAECCPCLELPDHG